VGGDVEALAARVDSSAVPPIDSPIAVPTSAPSTRGQRRDDAEGEQNGPRA